MKPIQHLMDFILKPKPVAPKNEVLKEDVSNARRITRALPKDEDTFMFI
ncbi:hypothetical protein HNV10_05600 [Winogradskyella litoriviva]|uniref:Uncharacterized protein n=1 Tax=Winogradskyella litoriviva TaxID=1220182 RepID=A0ABX2E378_9FLAO|nr:hypothetical protein [Winogradskyella litoriviva]NRD22704.1 hypothetical protein [Winogradskyella litoriviva]